MVQFEPLQPIDACSNQCEIDPARLACRAVRPGRMQIVREIRMPLVKIPRRRMRREIAATTRQGRSDPARVRDIVIGMNRGDARRPDLRLARSLVERPGEPTRRLDLPDLRTPSIGVEGECPRLGIHRTEHHRPSLGPSIDADRCDDRQMPLVTTVRDGFREALPGRGQLIGQTGTLDLRFGHARIVPRRPFPVPAHPLKLATDLGEMKINHRDLGGDVESNSNRSEPLNDQVIPSSSSAGQRILVIGAGGGIGRSLVGRLVARGACVVGASRDVDALGSVPGLESRHQLDARDPDATVSLVGSIHQDTPLDGIVNLAGCIALKPAHMVSTDEWNETIATKLTTAFSCVKAAGRHLKNGGSVVLVSTVAAGTGLSNHEAIAAAGAGVEGLARAAAATYAARGLRFNVVAPGLVDTPLASKITGSERALEHSRKMHPLGRIGVAEDVAPAIDWLLSPDASWITGQTVGIDGGLGALRVPAS